MNTRQSHEQRLGRTLLDLACLQFRPPSCLTDWANGGRMVGYILYPCCSDPVATGRLDAALNIPEVKEMTL